jgi:ribosomal protein L32
VVVCDRVGHLQQSHRTCRSCRTLRSSARNAPTGLSYKAEGIAMPRGGCLTVVGGRMPFPAPLGPSHGPLLNRPLRSC